MIATLLAALLLLGAGIAAGLVLSTRTIRQTSLTTQEALRRTVDQAEWQMQQMTRAAFEAMTTAARQARRPPRP